LHLSSQGVGGNCLIPTPSFASLPVPSVALVSQQAPIMTREQFVPQPYIEGMPRRALAAAFAALRALNRAHGNDGRHHHGTDHQCEQKHRLHA
jgi:hypothetical protein